MRRTLTLAALGITILGVAAFSLHSASGPAHAATTGVNVGNYYFCVPADSGSVCETDLNAGDTLTWTVEEGTHHVVQCADSTFTGCPPSGGFDGGNFSTGQTFSQTFTTAGTFFYECHIHPDEMKGKIVVAAVVTASPTPSPTAAATATAVSTVTAHALPSTGGPPSDGGSDLWAYALLALGFALLGGSAVTFAFARSKR